MKKLVSAIPAGLKCETRNSCFSMEPGQAVISYNGYHVYDDIEYC